MVKVGTLFKHKKHNVFQMIIANNTSSPFSGIVSVFVITDNGQIMIIDKWIGDIVNAVAYDNLMQVNDE